MMSRERAHSSTEADSSSDLDAGEGGLDYAAELERASRGLLAVSLGALSQMEQRVTTTHLRALQALERLGPCKVGELADAVDLAPSSASRLSDRLAEAGLITRSVAPDNRRATQLDLTPAGRDLVNELIKVRAASIRHIVDHMSEPDRRSLLRGAQAFSAACLTALRHAHPGDPGSSLTKEIYLDPAAEA